MRQQGRMQHAQASSFRQFSLGQIRALSIDQLLRQRYGLYLIGELPNLSEASEHQIRNALATLNPRSNDAVSTLNALTQLCTSENLEERNEGFESALILMQYNIIHHQQNFIGSLGPTMFELALQCCDDPSIISRMLSQNVIELNDVNPKGDTPLHIAAQYNVNPEILTLLINSGCQLNAKKYDGMTPIQMAAMENPNPEIISTFILYGEDVHQRDDQGNNLLHLAIEFSNFNVLKFLAKEGINIHDKNVNQYSPLELAKEDPQIDMNTISVLINKFTIGR